MIKKKVRRLRDKAYFNVKPADYSYKTDAPPTHARTLPPPTHTVISRRDRALWERGRGGRTLVQAASIGIVHDGHDPAAFVH